MFLQSESQAVSRFLNLLKRLFTLQKHSHRQWHNLPQLSHMHNQLSINNIHIHLQIFGSFAVVKVTSTSTASFITALLTSLSTTSIIAEVTCQKLKYNFFGKFYLFLPK